LCVPSLGAQASRESKVPLRRNARLPLEAAVPKRLEVAKARALSIALTGSAVLVMGFVEVIGEKRMGVQGA